LGSSDTQVLKRLENAGLVQSAGPTRLPLGAGVIAKNCDVFPRRTITKRPGYRRWRDVSMGQMVTAAFCLDQTGLIFGGAVEEISCAD